MAKRPKTLLGKFFHHLGSFWLAIALLTNLFLLTWLGTLEQIDKGINAVQQEYFESWLVICRTYMLPFALLGGKLTMGLFVINLFVGGLVRIRKSKATIGVITAHIGIAMMMVGGLIEHEFSKYGNIRLYEGQTGDAFQDYELWEVAIWDASQQTGIEEYLIPQEQFDHLDEDKSRTFERADLPFDLVLSRYMLNSRPKRAVGVGVPSAPVHENLFLAEEPRDKEQEFNIAGVYATALIDGGKVVEKTFLWGFEDRPWVVEAGGKQWAITLRHKMYEMPYELRLEKFIKDDHPGMTMARSFSSDVVRIEKDGTEHPVRIEMNEPLREKGLIIYQASYGPKDGRPGEQYSVLAVSVNPSDRVPWVAVTTIGIGLLWTFLMRLMGYLGKQRRRAAKVAATQNTKEARAAA